MEKHGSIIPIILANGNFPQHTTPLQILKKADYIVCTDGSLYSLLNYQQNHSSDLDIQNVKPDAIVGDGDSLPEELKEKYHSIYIEYAEQDYNDLTKATLYCIEKGFSKLIYLGIGGKRDDHAIANFSLLMWYKKRFNLDIEAYTDFGKFIPCCGDHSFTTKKGKQISIFNFGAQNLSSTNLKWNIYDFNELWQGTLNESLADSFSIKASGHYMIYINY